MEHTYDLFSVNTTIRDNADTVLSITDTESAIRTFKLRPAATIEESNIKSKDICPFSQITTLYIILIINSERNFVLSLYLRVTI